MPLFSVDIQKERFGMFWTNRYIVEAASVSAAGSAIALIADAEKQIHSDTITFVSGRASDFVPGNDNFVIVPLSGTGLLVVTGNPLQLFNCVRVDFSTGIGRPCRKYYRTAMGEGQVDGDRLSSPYFISVNAAMTDLLADVPILVDPSGEALTSFSTKIPVQMRQLRRGSKRRVTPVIPVA